ncbi:hypothetical protein [Flavicella sp.]|uniref:hypothetical protein n=1 Tax=Flavicella sp. TaxID=2957742 RepID=UPI003016DDE7
MVQFPYNTKDFAFTLGSEYLQFSTDAEGTYFSVELQISYFDFYESSLKTKILNYKIPLFQKYQKFNISEIIHRYMSRIDDYSNFVPGFQYKTVTVTIICNELGQIDGELIDTVILEGVKFIAGNKPYLFENNTALLERNYHPCRVTSEGVVNVSFLLPEGSYLLLVYKNNVLQKSIEVVADDKNNVYTIMVDVANFNGEQGDCFKVKISETNIFYEILVFPSTLYSTQLYFENEYNLLSAFQCTGGYYIDEEYTRLKQKYREDFQEVLKIVDTTKEVALTINTGHVLKTDTISLDSLILNKRAWLVVSDTVYLCLVPLSKKIRTLDSGEELFQFDLLFHINNPTDAQNSTYRF